MSSILCLYHGTSLDLTFSGSKGAGLFGVVMFHLETGRSRGRDGVIVVGDFIVGYFPKRLRPTG